jgi:hypothetical protein
MKKATALCADQNELGWIITMKWYLPHLTTAIFSIVMTRKKKNIAVNENSEEDDSKEESEGGEH